jgi:hypothetical protein
MIGEKRRDWVMWVRVVDRSFFLLSISFDS